MLITSVFRVFSFLGIDKVFIFGYNDLYFWSDGRVVEGGGLENRCAARYRGFESPLLRSERCESGRIGLPAKELFPKRVPGVRIPPFPYFEAIAQLDRASDCGSEGRQFEPA